MGLLNLIPPDNQLSQMLMGLQQPLNDLGVGLTRGKTWQKGLREASNYTEEQAPLRAKLAQEKLQADTEANTRNSTAAWLRTQPGGEKFAAALENGMIDGSTAFKSWLDASRGPEPTANMRDWQFAQENPGYADFLNPPSGAGGDLPSSVQEYEYAKQQGFTGSLLDYEKQKKAAGRAPMDPTTKKELFEAEDAAKAGDYVLSALDEAISLNDKAYDGPTADLRGDATSIWGDEAGVATARMKNVTTELALSQLKTIFGSMPTEGERKILLELQGSVNQARPVRAAILKRAREMAERRIADNKAKADALRSGGYFEEGYGQPATIPTVSDQAAYAALPSGTRYIAPDGTTRVKP